MKNVKNVVNNGVKSAIELQIEARLLKVEQQKDHARNMYKKGLVSVNGYHEMMKAINKIEKNVKKNKKFLTSDYMSVRHVISIKSK